MKNIIKKKANMAAQHFCSTGCFAGYDCGKPHGQGIVRTLDLYGDNPVCPLAKYGVESWSPKGFLDPRGVDSLKEDSLFYLCANCEHAELSEVGDELVVTRPGDNFRQKCVDCPVMSAFDCIQEARAEAAMS